MTLSTLLHSSCLRRLFYTLIPLQHYTKALSSSSLLCSLFCFLYYALFYGPASMPGERQTILIFGRWQEKAKARVMRVFLRQRRGLTALMALEDDVLDGQHAALPGGHRFKDDLRRKEKAHKHSDKWTRSQNATCRSPTGFEKVRLYTTAREDEESTIHNGHYCSLKHHLALVIGPNLLNLRRKWSGLQGCSRRIGCLSDGGVYSRCKSRLYR